MLNIFSKKCWQVEGKLRRANVFPLNLSRTIKVMLFRTARLGTVLWSVVSNKGMRSFFAVADELEQLTKIWMDSLIR